MHNVFLIRKMKAVEFDFFFIMKTDPHINFFSLQYQFLNHSEGVCYSYFNACVMEKNTILAKIPALKLFPLWYMFNSGDLGLGSIVLTVTVLPDTVWQCLDTFRLL